MSKNYVLLVVSYETSDGHGEADAVENLKHPPVWYRGTRKYHIELVEGLEEKKVKKLINEFPDSLYSREAQTMVAQLEKE